MVCRVVVSPAELNGPHMGHITKITLDHTAGQMSAATDIEGSMDANDLREILDAVNQGKEESSDHGYTTKETLRNMNEEIRERVYAHARGLGWKPRGSIDLIIDSDSAMDWIEEREDKPAATETCEVPRENLETNGLERFNDELSEKCGHLERRLAIADRGLIVKDQMICATRGAVRLLADLFGIESSEMSNAAKLAKQVHAKVSASALEQTRMGAELYRMRNALTGIGVPDVPDGNPDEVVSRQCQELSHHIDVVGRKGFGFLTVERDAQAVPLAPVTRDDKMAELKGLQSDATKLMIEMASVDGFVQPGMGPDEVMSKAMLWAMAEDRKNVKPAPELEKVQPVPERTYDQLASLDHWKEGLMGEAIREDGQSELEGGGVRED